MLGWINWAVAIAIAGFAVCAAAPAFAGDTTVPVQRLGPPDVEARREALLKQIIASPGDLDLAFQYATLSSQVGDYEAAISTLERMLIYAPNTPRLQLELGILYYKLGAYDVARAYFEQALANPSLPPSVAAQIRLYLSAACARRRPAGFLRLDLLCDPLGEQRQCRPRHAKRHPERHRLHARSAIGRPRGLERAQYRHHALRLGPEAAGRQDRVRRARLQHRLFR